MRNILFHLLALPFYIIILLPFPLFYLLSDIFYFIGYYIIGYRKKIIYQNLQNAFPKKSHQELITIQKKYYSFMVDLFMETFKLLIMSSKSIQLRFKFTNAEILQQFTSSKQSIIFVLGHYGNWELCGQSFHLKQLFQQDVLYHPLSNSFFEWLTYKLRSRFGVGLIPMHLSIKEMIRRKDLLTTTAFLADQTPSNIESCHWMQFLGQDTPVFLGTEKIAKKLGLPVVFVHINRIKRGYYESHFSIITTHPKEEIDNWITQQHTQMLEKDIVAKPELWLWSHRRWKHLKPIL